MNTDEQNESSDESDSSDTETTNDSEGLQMTLRLPPNLADDLDTWDDHHGMSHNAAITCFVAEGLSEE